MKTDDQLNATINRIKKKRSPAAMESAMGPTTSKVISAKDPSATSLKSASKIPHTMLPTATTGAEYGKLKGAKGLSEEGMDPSEVEESTIEEALEKTSPETKELMKIERTKGRKAAEMLLRDQIRKKNKNR